MLRTVLRYLTTETRSPDFFSIPSTTQFRSYLDLLLIAHNLYYWHNTNIIMAQTRHQRAAKEAEDKVEGGGSTAASISGSGSSCSPVGVGGNDVSSSSRSSAASANNGSSASSSSGGGNQLRINKRRTSGTIEGGENIHPNTSCSSSPNDASSSATTDSRSRSPLTSTSDDTNVTNNGSAPVGARWMKSRRGRGMFCLMRANW